MSTRAAETNRSPTAPTDPAALQPVVQYDGISSKTANTV